MNKINYQIRQFLHKDEKGLFVIHSTNYEREYWEDYSLKGMKADVERETELKFISDEKKLIETKLQERESGIRKSEKYLILT